VFLRQEIPAFKNMKGKLERKIYLISEMAFFLLASKPT
jgi:hypothetical protein